MKLLRDDELPGLEVRVRNGKNLEIWYYDQRIVAMSLAHLKKVYNDGQELFARYEDANAQPEAIKNEVPRSAVIDFKNNYVVCVQRLTGKKPQYKMDPSGNYYPHFIKATAMCRRLGVTCEEAFDYLTQRFTEMKGGNGAVYPYPNQMHGEKAQAHILNMVSQMDTDTIPPRVRALRLSQSRFKTSLSDDNQYQMIWMTLKQNKFSRFDLEYLKARQMQVLGEVQEWVEKHEVALKKREKAAESGGGKKEKQTTA